jgi:hypothetical protein
VQQYACQLMQGDNAQVPAEAFAPGAMQHDLGGRRPIDHAGCKRAARSSLAFHLDVVVVSRMVLATLSGE